MGGRGSRASHRLCTKDDKLGAVQRRPVEWSRSGKRGQTKHLLGPLVTCCSCSAFANVPSASKSFLFPFYRLELQARLYIECGTPPPPAPVSLQHWELSSSSPESLRGDINCKRSQSAISTGTLLHANARQGATNSTEW